jgi:hypothetical protein
MAKERCRNRPRVVVGFVALVVVVATTSLLGAPGSAHAQPAPPRHGLGLRPELPRAAFAAQKAASSDVGALDLPASVDLTAYAPPAGNQGSISSCVSWAIGYTAMGYFLNRDGVAGAPLAPMYTYSQVHLANDGGSFFSDTFDVATTQGVDAASHYSHGNFDWRTKPTRAEVTNARNWVLSGYDELDLYSGANAAKTAFKSALAAGKPVVLGMQVHSNFFYLDDAHAKWSTPTGSFVGYHAVTALGYDAYGITIENSWGSDWGDDGFARLSWSFVTGANLNGKYVYDAYAVDGVESRADHPVVSRVQPAIAATAGGSTITLTGVNFTPGATVRVGGTAAASVNVDPSGTRLTAVAPPHVLGVTAVTVTADGGTSATNPYTGFRYAAPPKVSTVSKRTVPVRGGTTVTIKGSNLRAAAVTFGKTAANEAVNGAGTAVEATVPAHAAGTVTMWVTTPAGRVSAGAVRFVAPPKVTAVTPRKGAATGGKRVVLTGAGLAGARVSFGATRATVESNSDGKIVVRTPRGVKGKQATITVRTVGGATSAGSYTWR